MAEPEPQFELIPDGVTVPCKVTGADTGDRPNGGTAGGITIDLKANPPGDGLGAALDTAAKHGGGKISPEAALTIMRAAGLVAPEPPEPDFDWYDEKEAIILNEQLSVAVYINKQGDAVIRRQQCAYEDEDAVVVVTYENLPKVIAALQKIAKAPKQEPE